MPTVEINDKTKPVPEKTVVYPATISLPDLRHAFPSGTLAKDDILVMEFTLLDKTGHSKPLDVTAFKVQMEEWPKDANQEILAVAYLNFAISNKPADEKEILP